MSRRKARSRSQGDLQGNAKGAWQAFESAMADASGRSSTRTHPKEQSDKLHSSSQQGKSIRDDLVFEKKEYPGGEHTCLCVMSG